MTRLLYWCVELIAQIHTSILRLNDTYEYHFSDKELHFLVMGLVGMGLVLLLHPVFRWLAKRGHGLVITGIYVFTLMVALTLAIEIGQKLTNTGCMEFADIMFGLVGFLAMFAVFSALRILLRPIWDWIKRYRDQKE